MTTVGWMLLGAAALVLLATCAVVVRLRLAINLLQAQVKELRADLADLSLRADSFAPLLADTRSALRKAQNDRLRADDLIQTATSLTDTADSAAKLAISMVSNPIVRVLSFFTGVKRGVLSLGRRTKSASPPPPVVVTRSVKSLRPGRRETELVVRRRNGRKRR